MQKYSVKLQTLRAFVCNFATEDVASQHSSRKQAVMRLSICNVFERPAGQGTQK